MLFNQYAFPPCIAIDEISTNFDSGSYLRYMPRMSSWKWPDQLLVLCVQLNRPRLDYLALVDYGNYFKQQQI